MLEIGTRPFAAMVEKPIVIVLFLQGFDFAINEIVDPHQKVGDILGDSEIHGRFSNISDLSLALICGRHATASTRSRGPA